MNRKQNFKKTAFSSKKSWQKFGLRNLLRISEQAQ